MTAPSMSRFPPGWKKGKRPPLQGPGRRRRSALENPHRAASVFQAAKATISHIATPVTVAEAILGGKIDVPTLDGAKLTVKVPPGASAARFAYAAKGSRGAINSSS